MSTHQYWILPSCAVFAMGFLSSPAFAEGPTQQTGSERALSWIADDSKLEWGPCPPFMPEGCAIAVLHGDPAQDNADVFFKVPAGADIPMHWHTSAERMVLVSGELHVSYTGQETVVMRPGTYAYGPAKAPHSAFCAEGADPCVLFIAFESPVDAIAGEPPAQ
jgi:quercetin dioxygenase-like cupin family protein